MDVFSIADASISLSLSQTQDTVGTVMLKKAIDTEQTSSETLIQEMSASSPAENHILDIRV